MQKGHFWVTKATGDFTYPHTMHDPEPRGIFHYAPPGCEVNLKGLKCVLTTRRQQAEFGWPLLCLGLLLLAAVFLVDINEGQESSTGFKSS